MKKDEFWFTFFQESEILPFDDKCSQIAAEIYKELKKNPDYIIDTKKHFDDIEHFHTD